MGRYKFNLLPDTSDQFNGTTINQTLWQVYDCAKGRGVNWGGSSGWKASYATETNGTLILKADSTHNDSCYWPYSAFGCTGSGDAALQTAGIQSNLTFSYGYFELRAKLPGNYNGSGQSVGTRFQPLFWTACVKEALCHDSIHNEFDIFEPDAAYTGNNNISGFWHEVDTSHCLSCSPNCSPCGGYCIGRATYKSVLGSYTNATPLFVGYNKYALEWNSNRVVFYFNDVPYAWGFNNPDYTAECNQTLYISLGLGVCQKFDPSTSFTSPKDSSNTMRLDYFNYYKLRLNCSNAQTFPTNSSITSFSYAVQSSITFCSGTGATSINLSSCTPPAGKQFVFRAVSYFKIPNSGYTFTVPAGTAFMLVPSDCN